MDRVRVLVCSLPAYGHLYPVMPLAVAFQRRGHDVIVATGEPFAGRLPLPAVTAIPEDVNFGWAGTETARRHPEVVGLAAGEAWRFAVEMFADVLAGRVAELMEPVLATVAADLVVYESTNVGAAVAADLAGIPAVAHGIGVWDFFQATLHAATPERLAAAWLDRGREPVKVTGALALGYLDIFPPSLQDPSGAQLSHRLALRPVAWAEPTSTMPAWLESPSERPRIYLTLGTLFFDAVETIRTVLAGLAELDVEVLLAVGPEGDPEAIGPQPESVHVERFVQQSRVLRQVSAVVHHGGSGTMLGALAEGLPQLIIPQGADHFYNGRALTAAGAGRCLGEHEISPAAVAEAVHALLEDEQLRSHALRLRDEIAAMPGPDQVVATLVEKTRPSR